MRKAQIADMRTALSGVENTAYTTSPPSELDDATGSLTDSQTRIVFPEQGDTHGVR